MTIKPWAVLLTIVVFGGLLAGIFWAGAQERAQQGPSFLRVDQQGDLHVVFHEKIFRLSPAGRYLNTYSLRDLGVGEMIGGLDFFRNGDVLLRSGDSVPNLYEQILIQLRIRQPESESGTSGDRLVRCDLDEMTCQPLAGFAQTFKRSFRIAIDSDDNIFIADTGREALYWLDSGGRKIAGIGSGFRLPNQLLRDDGRIVVTNTNRHELTFVPLKKEGFEPESSWHRLKVNTPEARQTRETWPMDLLKVGDEWLVLSQGGNMAFGDVFRFAEDGSYRSRFNLPDEVDPLAIAKLEGDVVVADYAGFRLLRYGDQGEPRGELAVPEIVRYATEVRAARDRFALYQTALWILFATSLVAGFAVAIVDEIKRQRNRGALEAERRSQAQARPVQQTPRPPPDDPDIHWIGTADSVRRHLLTAFLLIGAGGLLMVIAVMRLVSREVADGPFFVLFFSLLILGVPLVVALVIVRKMLVTIRIGVLREWLIVCDWRRRVAIGRGDEIVRTPTAISIEGVAVPLGRGKYTMLFDREEWSQWIEPRLANARILTGMEMLTWNWKYQRSQILAAVAALLVLLAWTLVR
jgi:hypothetical protein